MDEEEREDDSNVIPFVKPTKSEAPLITLSLEGDQTLYTFGEPTREEYIGVFTDKEFINHVMAMILEETETEEIAIIRLNEESQIETFSSETSNRVADLLDMALTKIYKSKFSGE